MTNTDTLTALRTRAMLAIRPEAPIGVMPTDNPYATMSVHLPDGSTGIARALDVLDVTLPGVVSDDLHIAVRQGQRCDLWHVSQLA